MSSNDLYPNELAWMDDLIEECPVIKRDASTPYRIASVPMHRVAEYIEAGIVTQKFVDAFTENPNGATNCYKWYTRVVDELRNLYILAI